MSLRVNISKLLLHTIGAWAPPKRRLFGGFGNALRVLFVKGICAKVGRHCNVEKGARINAGAVLEDYATIGVDALIDSGTIIHGHNLMAHGVQVFTHNHKYDLATHSFRGFEDVKPVHIGQYTWIGANVIILPGVTIGDHSIVGAGSVVTKSVPPGVMAAGNPCRVKKVIDPAFAPRDLLTDSSRPFVES